jgi:hypothetical protein
MPVDYRARTGDCISSVAATFGVAWATIWDHPNNADLKKKRKDPNILKEGDVVHVPDRRQKEVAAATGQVHSFVLKRAKAKVRLRVVEEPRPASKPQKAGPRPDRKNPTTEDPEPDKTPLEDRPRKDLAYVLEIGTLTYEGKTGSDGYLEHEIPEGARSGRLILDPGTPNETVVPLNLGHLDPVDEVSGVKQRLANLTFPCGTGDEATPELAAALRAFQAKHGLDVTGEIDDATRNALREAHGS